MEYPTQNTPIEQELSYSEQKLMHNITNDNGQLKQYDPEPDLDEDNLHFFKALDILDTCKPPIWWNLDSPYLKKKALIALKDIEFKLEIPQDDTL